MTIRGRPPKPTALKVLNGNPGKQPLNKLEPKPKPLLPKCPAWLDPAAKKEWKRVVPELERIGMLTCVDGAALEGYCQSHGRWVAAEQFIQKHGMVFKTQSGYLQQVPQVSIAPKYLQLVKAFCSEFGLTPCARTRIEVKQPTADDDPMEAILRNAGR